MVKLSISFTTIAIVAILLLSSFTVIPTVFAQESPTAAIEWQLNITGLVEQQLNLTLSDIIAMPQTTIEGTIYCVDFPTSVVKSGSWTGVELATLLEKADVLPSAVKVGFFAPDGYSTDLDLETATSGNVVIAYEKDGVPLSETLRLVVPGKWGYKWISQVTNITLFDYDFKGKWESLGYSDGADVATTGINSIHVPTVPTPSQSNETSGSSSQDSNSSAVLNPPQETQESQPESKPQTSDSFLGAWIASAITVVFCAIILTYFVKRRRLDQRKA
jgi:DMSO/TMAO reductase YedYZ molybdopterin-dependent catalytic subunit